MRFTRLLVGTFTAALVGSVTVLTAAPSGAATAAGAAATCAPVSGTTAVTTRIYLAPQSKSTFKYRQSIGLRGQVQYQDPSDLQWYGLSGASVQLSRAFPNKAYVALSSNTTAGSPPIFTFTTTSWGNATYKASFAGASSSTHTFCPAAGTRRIKGSRNEHVRIPSGTITFVGNVDPGYARRYVTVQKKNCLSCGWRTYTKVATNGDGAFRARLTAPRSGRWYFRTYIPGTSPTFAPALSPVYYTFRSSGRRA